ncbi:MAG: asparagine--tRNA ligase [Nanoarchaeota archaeon]|nr:asparagine--tRNA ligase [Nanoarchaeota archaeon]
MKFQSISSAMKKGKGKVALRGWVYRERGSNKMYFLVLRDASNIIQCVLKRENFGDQWDEIKKLKIESSVELEGNIKTDKRAPTGFEVEVSKLKIIHIAEDYPINKDLNENLLGDRRHLWLRSRKMTAMLKIRSTIFGAFHEYFRKNNFYEFQSPLMLNAAGESGSSVFKVDYFGKKMFLAQTWQLHAETAIFALEKIYTMAPSFRAEKSNTTRHLCEYWHCEMEAAWAKYEELQVYAEGLLKHVVKKVLAENKEELEILERNLEILESTANKKFPNITYDEALKVLEKKGMKVKWGEDLGKQEEDKLSSLYDTPIIIRDYPKLVKAFYMKESLGMEKVPIEKKTVQGFDVIGPEKYGELFGASQREEDIEIIKENLKREGENLDNYEFYFDSRRYGSVPHGGFGVGVDRIVSWICGMKTIKDAIAFPRTMRRMSP